MAKKIKNTKHAALIRDIFNAEHDVVALAAAHELSPDELASWAGHVKTQRCLTGLCVLADMQTQLLLSRYRLLAATRLINLATAEGEAGSDDVARRACVDLLKLDLKRADATTDDDSNANAATTAREVDALRAMIYGQDDNNSRGADKDD